MGDTRCDSVLERRNNLEIPQLPTAAKDSFVFVAGSTWPLDETCIFPGLQEALNKFPKLFLVLAPHEPTEEERRLHAATHCPYQAWCRSCVAGRGKADQHHAREGDEDAVRAVLKHDH